MVASITPPIMETMNLMEVIIMDVEKFIRVLGYIVYTALWSPVIVLAFVLMPLVWAVMCIRFRIPFKTGVELFTISLMSGIHHDMNFIRTGKW